MKSFLTSALFLFILNLSHAQAPVSDSLKIGCRPLPSVYYIDGIRVSNSQDSTQTVPKIEEVKIITGGLPVVYGDINSSIIQIDETLPAETKKRKPHHRKRKKETE